MSRKLRRKGNCPVFVRLRPGGEADRAVQHTPTSIVVQGKQFEMPVITGDQLDTYAQADFHQLAVDFVNGFDLNVLAFGQTGSGKTHSVFGPPGLMERAGAGEFGTEVIPEYGICPRLILHLIDHLESLNKSGDPRRFVLHASAVELSWVGSADLLFGKSPCHLDKMAKPMELVGQTQIPLVSRESALNLFSALATRNSRATKLNESSSRSMCLVILALTQMRVDRPDLVHFNCLQFCDMAGSERMDDAHDHDGSWRHGDAAHMMQGKNHPLWEGMHTNFSLACLSQAVNDVVRSRDPKSLSFRTYMTELPLLLQGSLVGTAKTVLLVTCRQTAENASQSLAAVQFANTFKQLHLDTTLLPTHKIATVIAQQKEIIQEAQTAIDKQVKVSVIVFINQTMKGKFMDVRLAQRKHAQSRLDTIAQLLTLVGNGKDH